MFCRKCGKEIMDDAVICVHCGCSTENNGNKVLPNADDQPSTGLAVLGFFCPIVGLILYLVNKDSSPKKACSAGKGALIGLISSVAVSMLYGIIVGVLMAL